MYFFPAGHASSHRFPRILVIHRPVPGHRGRQRYRVAISAAMTLNPANCDSAVVHVVEAMVLGVVEGELEEEVDTPLLLHIATYATIDGALTSSCRYRRGRVFQRRPSVILYTKLNIYPIRFEIDVKAVFSSIFFSYITLTFNPLPPDGFP